MIDDFHFVSTMDAGDVGENLGTMSAARGDRHVLKILNRLDRVLRRLRHQVVARLPFCQFRKNMGVI